MPELPEVEVARRNVERWLKGATLSSVEVHDAKLAPSGMDTLVEATVSAVLRHGKQLAIAFDDGRFLLVHLRMTGNFVSGDVEKARFVFHSAERSVSFVDPRRFGTTTMLDQAGLDAEWAKLGPEPWPKKLTGKALAGRFSKTRRLLKVALLDQARLAGVGNIIATEGLHEAKLSPFLKCTEVKTRQWTKLAKALHTICERSVQRDDESEIAYVNLGGENPFEVYGREGELCPRCGHVIARVVQAQRSTFYCAKCVK